MKKITKIFAILFMCICIFSGVYNVNAAKTYIDTQNDVYHSSSLTYYYTGAVPVGGHDYIDMISLESNTNHFKINVKNGLNSLSSQLLAFVIVMNQSATEMQIINVLYNGTGWEYGVISTVGGSNSEYGVPYVTDSQIDISCCFTFIEPSEDDITAIAYEYVVSEYILDFYIDYYPDSHYGVPNPSGGWNPYYLYWGIGGIGGIIGMVLLIMYLRSCDRSWNSESNRCKSVF